MGLLKEYEDLPVEWKLAPEKHLEEIFRRVDRYIQDAEGYYLGEDLEAVRDAVRNLRNLAQARAELRKELEYLDTRRPLWEVALDFDLDTQPTPEEVAEWERRQQEDRAKVIAQRKTLRLFFIFACRIYRQVGTRPSGGEVSRLKRLELTDGMKKALDEVKRPARTSFDDRGRLPGGTVSAIYSGLASAGFISGPLETFRKHFDLEPFRDGAAFLPPPLEPLTWTGGPALLGYFIWRYWKHLPVPGENDALRIRNYAVPVLNAFSIPEPQRRSVRRLLSLLNEGRQKTVRGAAAIDRIFDGLQGTGATSAK